MEVPEFAESSTRETMEESYDFYSSVYVTDYEGVLREVEIWSSEEECCGEITIYLQFTYTDKNDRLHRIMYLGLSRVTPALFGVEEVSLYKNFQGLGLAAKLYASLLQLNPGIVIRAGSCQSPGGRKIWCDLALMEGVNVFGGIGEDEKNFFPVDVVPDEDYRELRRPGGSDIYNDHGLSLYTCKSRAT